jgi:hypothetical protein
MRRRSGEGRAGTGVEGGRVIQEIKRPGENSNKLRKSSWNHERLETHEKRIHCAQEPSHPTGEGWSFATSLIFVWFVSVVVLNRRF